MSTTETIETTEPAETEETTTAPGEPATTQDNPQEPAADAESFPKEYVVKLRQEAADNRVKAKRADDLAARLHTALVTATGRLADPTDLPFNESHLEDPEALTAAIDDMLTRKAHLASRRPSGDIGQGILSPSSDSVNLAGILRSNAR